jgi:hypothetical protein
LKHPNLSKIRREGIPNDFVTVTIQLQIQNLVALEKRMQWWQACIRC